MQKARIETAGTDIFRVKRGDDQFTGAGSGIAHSEKNELKHHLCQCLQIWVLSWKQGLHPVYRRGTFFDEVGVRGNHQSSERWGRGVE